MKCTELADRLFSRDIRACVPRVDLTKICSMFPDPVGNRHDGGILSHFL